MNKRDKEKIGKQCPHTIGTFYRELDGQLEMVVDTDYVIDRINKGLCGASIGMTKFFEIQSVVRELMKSEKKLKMIQNEKEILSCYIVKDENYKTVGCSTGYDEAISIMEHETCTGQIEGAKVIVTGN